MIYTVTCNPSLDYVVSLKEFRFGAVNRTQEEQIYPGGKGINVSLMLQHLNVSSIALGFTAGETGSMLTQLLEKSGCHTDFIHLEKGSTRINVKLRTGIETEINGQGPTVSQEALHAFLTRIAALQNGDILVLGGSIPQSLPCSIYTTILEYVVKKDILTVVDTTGNTLLNTLVCHPFLIKPNHYELAQLFGKDSCETAEEIITYGKRLQKMGARNVLVSRAGDGAVLLCESGRIYQSLPPKGTVVNSVGAGDSMVAGFLAGYLPHKNLEEAFQLGLLAGSASAFHEWLATKEEIEELRRS